MEGLARQARKFEKELEGIFEWSDFLYNLLLGVALARITAKTPCLKPEFIRAAERLRLDFEIIKQDVRRAGPIRCWQFRRRRYRRFALKIARLSGRLKEAAGRLGG